MTLFASGDGSCARVWEAPGLAGGLMAAVAQVLGLSRARAETDRWIAFTPRVDHYGQITAEVAGQRAPGRGAAGLELIFPRLLPCPGQVTYS